MGCCIQLVSISSPSSEGGGISAYERYEEGVDKVSISSPSSEGGGRTKPQNGAFSTTMFPLVLLQAKVVGPYR